jgi:hypothetical protein
MLHLEKGRVFKFLENYYMGAFKALYLDLNTSKLESIEPKT